MKLPISLLLFVALSQATSTSAKSSNNKSPEKQSTLSKHQDTGPTSKRTLYEGNFGERKDGLLTKYGTTGVSTGIKYAQDLKNILPDQSPTHQIFGARLPQIAKISDVLSGQGPSFEAAVANHLYAPVSVYHARLSTPTLFEVPSPAASKRAHSNPKAYQPLKPDTIKLQEPPTKEAEFPRLNFNNAPIFALKPPAPNHHHSDPYGPKYYRLPSKIQDILYQPRTFSRTPPSSIFPLVYDQPEPIRYQGDLLPSQFLQQQVYHLLPVGPSNQEQNRGEKHYPNQGSHEELKAEPTQTPKLQNIASPKQGYHVHPNGAFSFVSFTQNLPHNTQSKHHGAQSQGDKPLTQQQLEEISPQYQVLSRRPHLQKQKIQYTPISHKYIQQVPKYQIEPQFITLQKPIQNKPMALNPLHRLLFQDSPLVRQPQTIQFQHLPAFKPLPQSQLTAESFFQPSKSSPYVPLTHIKPNSKPNGHQDQSTQNPKHIDQKISLVMPQQNLTPLPPLKPNYNQYVKPLEPLTQTSPIFLPTPLQPLPSSTPKLQLEVDQLGSSTTIQPDIKEHKEPRHTTVNEEIQSQTPTPQSLQPEIIHQSQTTGLPISFQSTEQPYSMYETQSEYVQHTSSRPEYQPIIQPQTTPSTGHEITVQQQELQELVIEPSPQPSSASSYQSQIQQNQQAQKAHQLQSQQLLAEMDQLRSQEFHRTLQKLLAQQYQEGLRQLQYLQQQSLAQIEPQQYQNQQHLETQQLHPQQQNQPEKSTIQPDTKEIQLKKYQKEHPESQNQIEITTNPSQKILGQLEQLQNFQSQSQTPNHSQFKTPTGEQHVPLERAPAPTESNPFRDFSRFLDPILSRLQPILPGIYAQPQELVHRPGFSHNFASYPDVHFFGTK